MKRRHLPLIFLLLLSIFLPLVLSGCSLGEPVRRLYVYNWGEYMSLEGGDDGVHVNHAFEEWYEETYGERVEVVYSIFASNEEMYAKLRTGSAKVDIIIPSEYMIERLIAEDMLLPLDFDLIPAYGEAIEERFHTIATAPYCVPYTYGYLGLIYDESLEDALFDENGQASWRALWNQLPGDMDLSGNILTFNNSRDAFGIAQFLLNYERGWQEGMPAGTDLYVNTSDRARWDEVYELLLEQRTCLQAYVMDEIFNKMESGAALLAPYYAGDYFTMVDVNDRLCFAYPKEGTNFFYDAMCVPTCSREPELAQIYMNFLLGGTEGETLDIAIANAEWICYSSPNKRVTMNLDYLADMTDEEEGYGAEALRILYPGCDFENLIGIIEPYREWRNAALEESGEYDPADYEGPQPTEEMFSTEESEFVSYPYQNLDNETLEYANGRWEALKLASAPCNDIYIFSVVIAVLLIGGGVALFLVRRYRSKYY